MGPIHLTKGKGEFEPDRGARTGRFWGERSDHSLITHVGWLPDILTLNFVAKLQCLSVAFMVSISGKFVKMRRDRADSEEI
jgi:hypothetical protein